MYVKVPPRSKNSTSSQLHSQTSFGSSSFSVQRQAKKAKGSKGIQIQAKLTIGEAGDKYEQEADRVASQVVNQINAPAPQLEGQSQPGQRQAMPEELQMKPMLQLRASVGGMTAAPDLEASIQQARGSGQQLAENIRKPMEQAFGADFTRVKIHTDAQSDQLNRAIQARAFTTGQDLFFRQGEYNPESRGGQELIAHELTHVVQQNGGAVQRCSLTIQRDIGFEYETNQDTYLARGELTEDERQRTDIPQGATALRKGDVLVGNMDGLHAKADQGGAGVGSNLEFETDHFPETPAGSKQLHQALKNLERFCKLMEAKGNDTPQLRSSHLASAFGGNAPNNLRYIRALGNVTGNPQTTAGVRLDKIAELMERGVGGPTEGPLAVPNDAPVERFDLGGQNISDFQMVGNAPGHVRHGIETYRDAYAGGGGAPLPKGFPSDGLVGLCAYLLSYIIRGSVGQMYAKQIAPLMARTDFGSMFTGDLVRAESAFLSAAGGEQFIQMFTYIMNAAGVEGGMTGQLFSQEPLTVVGQGLNIATSVTRQAWLTGISQNNDLLTPRSFPSEPARPQLQGLGEFGDTHDPDPTGGNVPRPILEFRRMRQNVAPHEFTTKAMGVFNYIVALNEARGGSHPTYAPVPRKEKQPKLLQQLKYKTAGG